MKTRQNTVPKGRQSIARGVSPWCRSWLWLLIAVLIAASCGRPAVARPIPSGALDDELMKDRVSSPGNPVDELDRQLLGPAERRSNPQATPSQDDLWLQRLPRELGTGAIEEGINPLLSIARQMRQAEGLIRRNDAGEATQSLQKGILAELEQLLQQARKACSQSQSSSNPPPGSTSTPNAAAPPQAKSGGKKPNPKPSGTNTQLSGSGEGKQSDASQVQELMEKVWGTLPQREREQVRQLPAEEFLPKYRPLIEEYFRRLSEEKGGRQEK